MEKGKERFYRTEGFSLYHQNIPKKQLAPHDHMEAHLIVPLQGSVELKAGNQVYSFGPGRMIYVNSKVRHSFSGTGEMGERLIVQFLPGKILRKIDLDVAVLPTHPLIKDLLMALFVHEGEPFVAGIRDLFEQVLFHGLSRQANEAGNALFTTQQRILASTSPQLRQLTKLMEEDLSVDLEELARRTGASSRTLSRLCMNETGLSPKELYTYFRIQRACDLIYQNRLNITGIAFECGYNSLSQFISNFKKWTGQRPSEFSR